MCVGGGDVCALDAYVCLGLYECMSIHEHVFVHICVCMYMYTCECVASLRVTRVCVCVHVFHLIYIRKLDIFYPNCLEPEVLQILEFLI